MQAAPGFSGVPNMLESCMRPAVRLEMPGAQAEHSGLGQESVAQLRKRMPRLKRAFNRSQFLPNAINEQPMSSF